MYQKYHTDALVLGSREHGEADKAFALFTKDFGLVRARAVAVRNERSKMRYAMQKYARANVSLIKGKRGWRIAGATATKSASGDLRGISTFARISELVLRLVHGEEKNEYLFAALSEAHDALMSAQGRSASGGVPPSDITGIIEIVCVARVLFALGYISSEALSTALFTHTAYTGESLLEAETLKDKLLRSINKAISETQL
jgi:hypothetical protein